MRHVASPTVIRTAKKKRVACGLAAVSSGILQALSFPPMELAEAAWVAFIPLLVISRSCDPRASFRWGWLSGFVFWSVTISWLLNLARFGTPLPIVILAWLMLSAYCALYTGAFLMVVSASWKPEKPFTSDRSQAPVLFIRFRPFCFLRRASGTGASYRGHVGEQAGVQSKRPGGYIEAILRVLLISLIWVGFEYIRSTLFSGFAWNTLGVSQYRNTAIIQVAEWGGVYAVSFLVMLMNNGLGLTGMNIADQWRKTPGSGRRIQVELITAFVLVIVCMSWGIRRSITLIENPEDMRTLRVALIQGNIPQNEKWTEEADDAIYTRLEELTLQSFLSDPDLIIWPETAVPHPVMKGLPTGDWIADFAKRGTPLLIGAMVVDANETRDQIYNSALLFDGLGDVAAEYRKRHLVPFGEYIPLDRHITFLRNIAPLGYSCTPGSSSTVFRLKRPPVAFSTLICFEDTLAGLGRESVRNGAELLINQTNDAWFENTSAGVQHMSHCVFRSVENRVPSIRCANMGVSCLISAVGTIDSVTENLLAAGDGTKAEFRIGDVVLSETKTEHTFYTRYGDCPFAIPCAIISGVYLVLLLVKRDQNC